MVRKTLRVYILKGGIKGKYFIEKELKTLEGMRFIYTVYRVTDIESRRTGRAPDLRIKLADTTDSERREISEHYYDKEATPKQIQFFRAKESALAKA